jgi:predicted O-linked N-acetylglucosamine transferase (SPINDLY family)
MDKCFLSYTPSIGIDNLPDLAKIQPSSKNGYLTIGCFNRYNKINDTVIEVWEEILAKCSTVRFVIKTKEFLTPSLKEQFIKTWKNPELLKRIEILNYSDLYTQHLVDYNLMDVALDTFPYSGTTTSCEALMMGVPVLTLFDSTRQYHSQNVTSSLMINSSLEEYVVYSKEEYINKVVELSQNLDKLNCLKQNVRDSFVKGPICNYSNFTSEFEDKLIDTYVHHKW